MDEEPRAYTAEEVRDMMLNHIHTMVDYWAGVEAMRGDRPLTVKDRVEGVAFSILVMLDGHSMTLPSVTLKLDPHPDDKEFMRSEGENWFEPGMEITDVLHDHFYKKPGNETSQGD